MNKEVRRWWKVHKAVEKERKRVAENPDILGVGANADEEGNIRNFIYHYRTPIVKIKSAECKDYRKGEDRCWTYNLEPLLKFTPEKQTEFFDEFRDYIIELVYGKIK